MRKALIPILISTALSLFLILIGTDDPGSAVSGFFLSPLLNRFYLSSMISRASLLLLSGTGICIAFGAGSFNLGGEGQAYSSGLVAALVLSLAASWGVPAIAAILLAIVAALGSAGIQGATSGYLKNHLGIDPLISTFLLSSALLPVFDGLIIGPLRDTASNLLAMPTIPEYAKIPHLPGLPRIHGGILLALLLWGAYLYWYRNSRTGFELKLLGANPEFARFSGVPVGRRMVLAMTFSAVFMGIAGFISLTAVQYAAVIGFTSGLGWNGIAVSLLGGNRLENLPFSALIFAYLGTASDAAMVYTDFSFELSSVIQASIFLLISVQYRRELISAAGKAFSSRKSSAPAGGRT